MPRVELYIEASGYITIDIDPDKLEDLWSRQADGELLAQYIKEAVSAEDLEDELEWSAEFTESPEGFDNYDEEVDDEDDEYGEGFGPDRPTLTDD